MRALIGDVKWLLGFESRKIGTQLHLPICITYPCHAYVLVCTLYTTLRPVRHNMQCDGGLRWQLAIKIVMNPSAATDTCQRTAPGLVMSDVLLAALTSDWRR